MANHVAIMKKSWGLIAKILSGEKTVESRWYKTRRTPWDKIKTGDTIYFKDSGEPVTVKAKVTKVFQFDNLNPAKTKKILSKHSKADLGVEEIMPEIREHVKEKKYAIFVFFNQVKQIKPFEINKTGFGLQAAWITVESINQIKRSFS